MSMHYHGRWVLALGLFVGALGAGWSAEASAEEPAAQAGDLYVLPQGAGTKDGSSWQNAMSPAKGGLQQAWESLQPGRTLWIGSGEYHNVRMELKAGGTNDQYKKMIGKDTGAGLPVFVGTFDKANPRKSGKTFLSPRRGASDWWVQDLKIKNCQAGISGGEGQFHNVRIINVDVEGCREGITLGAGATAQDPAAGSHEIEIRDCDIKNYTKRGIRLRDGNYNVRIIHCTADAGGKDWATEPFQMSFNIEGKTGKDAAEDHDITFEDCTARNNYNDAGPKYWNADGFMAEGGVYNLSFLRCRSFDNTDGGWDVKGKNILLQDCVSLRNKRNFRLWGEARLVNCVGAWSMKRGGNGSETGLWTVGQIVAERCTFHNNGIDVAIETHGKDGGVKLVNCLVSMSPERKGALTLVEKGSQLTNEGSVLWEAGKGGEDPQYVNAAQSWEGDGDGYNSRKFEEGKGYHGK